MLKKKETPDEGFLSFSPAEKNSLFPAFFAPSGVPPSADGVLGRRPKNPQAFKKA
jgi:hypothetical protein